ncbi:MAG: hypothetical protein ABSA72_10155 [Nitrososphaerales archaeon]
MNDTLTVPSPAELAKDVAELNELEKFIATLPGATRISPPLQHRFTPGLYSRTIFMPKGMVCTSKIHKTEHQFVVSKGVLRVWSKETGWVKIRAPYIGVTKPGARRALHILEDTIWTTFHPTTLTDLAEIEASLVEPHEIPCPCSQ